MRSLTVVALLAAVVLSVNTGAADYKTICVPDDSASVNVCAREYNEPDGSCATRDEHRTEVWADTFGTDLLYAKGWETCQPSTLGEGSYHNQGMHLRTPILLISWVNGSSPQYSDCYMWFFMVVEVDHACVAPPPNPGWGNLLP